MSITDELREWVRDGKGSLLAIADRIDAVHETAMSRTGQLLADVEKDRDYNYANWQECKQKVLQGNITFDELNAKIERLEDELLHCVKLPKDADGEYIHIGDVMEWPDHTDDPFEVIGIGNGTLYYVEGGVIQWTRAETKRHYTPDTWERIIEDAIMGGDEDALVARCRALAGDAE